jgi:hypothetical protein
MAKRFNCRRVKLHHSYTISELSVLIGAHKHTIGRWIAAGLKTTDARRPLLIHGADFRAFMKAREPIKQPCQLGEFYCFRCRAPRRLALNMADYHPRTVAGPAERNMFRLRAYDLSGDDARQARSN